MNYAQHNERNRMEMKMNKRNCVPAPRTLVAMTAAAFGAVALLAGCGTSTVSKDVAGDGTAGEIVFPTPSSAWMKGGIFPNVDNLRQVGAGMTKGQLYDLLGAPHFAEGIGAVREWDYVFQFRARPGTDVTTCQYKVLFDKDILARTFHWKPAGCTAFLGARVVAAPPAMAQAPRPEPLPRSVKQLSISTDGLFRFGKHAPQDLLPEGRRRIAALAVQMQRDFRSVSSVRITGHADRLGSFAANDALSLSRAHTVRALFVQAGISADLMQVRGEGSRHPLVTCSASLARPALVACLQPNRRVEVEVDGAP